MIRKARRIRRGAGIEGRTAFPYHDGIMLPGRGSYGLCRPMMDIQLGFFTACLYWTALTGLVTLGTWALRKRRWLIGTACILMALPYPLFTVYGMVAMNRVNTFLQSGGVPIYARFGNIESALKSDTLSLKSKSVLSKLVARDLFVFEGRIGNYWDENGRPAQFSPDSTDIGLMLNMKTSQKLVESITMFGLLFSSSLPIGLIAGFLLPNGSTKKRDREG